MGFLGLAFRLAAYARLKPCSSTLRGETISRTEGSSFWLRARRAKDVLNSSLTPFGISPAGLAHAGEAPAVHRSLDSHSNNFPQAGVFTGWVSVPDNRKALSQTHSPAEISKS